MAKPKIELIKAGDPETPEEARATVAQKVLKKEAREEAEANSSLLMKAKLLTQLNREKKRKR